MKATVTDQEKRSSNDAPLTNSETAISQPAEDTIGPTDTLAEIISAPRSPEETQRMLRYLQVHHIELEAQNEQLRFSQLVLDTARATYLNLYDFAPVGYCTVSEEGGILQANITAAKLLGVSRDELRNCLLSSFIIKEDQDRYFLHRKQITVTDEPCSYELRMVKSDGTPFWVHLAACAALDADGIRVFRVVLSNITERKMAAVALHESEQFKQAVLDSISSQIAVLNHEGTIVAVNEAWRKFAIENSNLPEKIARHTQIGTNYLDICQASIGESSEGAAEAHAGVLSVLAGELPRFNLDYACHSPSQQRWLTLSVTPIGGKSHGAVITHIDITARKIAEENLAQHRDALVREVHHRIKNNLQGVAGLLQRELGKFMGLDPHLAAAIGQVNAIAIVHGLQAEHSDETIRLCDSIRHICTMVSDLAQRPILFQIEHEHAFIPVQIDSNEAVSVALVLNELILNAVKHSPEGSSTPVVTLDVDALSTTVRIRNGVTGAPDFDINTGDGLGTGLSLVCSLLPKDGAHLAYEFDPQGFILATLCLTAPVVAAAIPRNND
jgi:PAS domain S-box-containing protein